MTEQSTGRDVALTADVDGPVALPPGWTADLVEVDDGAGLDGWREHATPVRVGRVVLQPPWVPPLPARPGDVVVELDPGRAFGSGSHPSTRLALRALQPLAAEATRVLDVGCGSGVLAVATLLLGATRATAVDVDPAAILATRAVAGANGVADRIEVRTAPLPELAGRFDLVLANVPGPVHAEVGPAVLRLVAPGAHLVLSGFLDEQADEVLAAYRGVDQVELIEEDGWACVRASVAPAGADPPAPP